MSATRTIDLVTRSGCHHASIHVDAIYMEPMEHVVHHECHQKSHTCYHYHDTFSSCVDLQNLLISSESIAEQKWAGNGRSDSHTTCGRNC